MVQIIASDMDGTLLNDKMVISKRNAAAVKEAQKQDGDTTEMPP